MSTVGDGRRLFSGHYLPVILGHQRTLISKAARELLAEDPRRTDADLAAELQQRFSFRLPKLLLERSTKSMETESDYPTIAYRVPFTGEALFFHVKSSLSLLEYPECQVEQSALLFRLPIDDRDLQAITSEFERLAELVEEQLRTLSVEVQFYENELPMLASDAVRRARIEFEAIRKRIHLI